jgi:hypothetical protein
MRTHAPRPSSGHPHPLAHRVGALLATTLLATFLTACGASVATPGDDVVLELVAIAPQSAEAAATRLDGATVAGAITVSVRASGGLAAVAFDLDGARLGEATVEPFVVTVDTRGVADGAHELVARATLTDGSTRSLRAAFAVANGASGFAPGAPFVAPPATLYVAPNGNDANDGRTPDRPLRTITRATQIVQPGDVVYLRGGTYPIQTRFDRSGTATQPIIWTSYPGEWAILDGSDQTPVTSQHRVWIAASWNVFANFEVRHGPQEGIQLYQAHDNLLTNLVTHHHHYSGILVMQSNRNRFEYLTTHDNYDLHNPSGRIGDDADGISISSGDRNTLYRVIAYANSDDGIDAWRSTNTLIDSSISYANGRGTHGNGNGIKAGGNAEQNNTTIRNTIAFHNKANGFDDNDGRNITYYNNTAYANGGYAFAFGSTATLRNNLAYGSPIGIWGTNHHDNSWNQGITNPAFLSTDPNHPDFLALADHSPAIDAGTHVGLTYTGTAPDLGALEHHTHIAQLIGTPLATTPTNTTLASNTAY